MRMRIIGVLAVTFAIGVVLGVAGALRAAPTGAGCAHRACEFAGRWNDGRRRRHRAPARFADQRRGDHRRPRPLPFSGVTLGGGHRTG